MTTQNNRTANNAAGKGNLTRGVKTCGAHNASSRKQKTLGS